MCLGILNTLYEIEMVSEESIIESLNLYHTYPSINV